MKTIEQINSENATRLSELREMATAMSASDAAECWAEFQAQCAEQDSRRANDFHTSYAPLAPDVWRDGNQFAAGVKLGHINL